MVPWNKNSTEGEVVQLPNGKETEVPTEKPQTKAPEKSFEETKETFRLTLGSYRGAVVPLSILFFGYTCGALAVFPMAPDTRVKDWFLMDNSVTVLTLCVLYVLSSVVWGPNFMKNREPFKLKKTMIAYNAFQVVLSTYIFFEVGLCGWFFDYSFFCEPCDYTWSYNGIRIASVGWLFFISKIIDFIDTAFFILNKKFSNVSVLHIVHHSCMCISMWYGIKYTPGGHMTFMGFLNSGVHAVMYTYYLLSAFGPALRPYLWWKKYLTKIQLIQFVAIFLHAAQLFVIDCPNVPIGLAAWTCIYAVIFFSLFIDFYYRAYLFNSEKSVRAKAIKNEEPQPVLDHSMPNGNAKRDSWEMKNLKNGHIRSPSINFRLDTCLRERPSPNQ